jgi:hypothetical protein
MKKCILILPLLVVMGISSSFAGTRDGIDPSVVVSFKASFRNVRDVQWDARKEFVKASFNMNGQVFMAYFAQDGDLMAVTRHIRSSELPARVRRSLRKNYSQYWITDLVEVVSNGETTYYVSLENPDRRLILSSTGGSAWGLYSQEIKE